MPKLTITVAVRNREEAVNLCKAVLVEAYKDDPDTIDQCVKGILPISNAIQYDYKEANDLGIGLTYKE